MEVQEKGGRNILGGAEKDTFTCGKDPGDISGEPRCTAAGSLYI